MKRAGALLVLLALLACFAGCMGEQYTQREKDSAQQKGEQMMREWLELTLPGAELVSVEPYVFHNLGVAPYQLTELVSGTLRNGAQEQRFWLDTSCGEVWFEQSGETMDALGALGGAYVAEALGLGGSWQLTGAQVHYDIGVLEQPDVLPAELVLSGKTTEEILRAEDGRPPLPASFSYRVPDDFSLSGFTLDEAQRALDVLLSRYGMQASADVHNGSEMVALSAEQAYYTREGFIDLPDFRVRATVYERRETLDAETGKTASEIIERGASDLVVSRTADGWTTSFPNGYFSTAVYAYDNSEMPRHAYVFLKEPGVSNDYDRPLAWKETDLGWALCFTDRDQICFLSDKHVLAETDG